MIIGTCGHEIKDFEGSDVTIKEYSQGERCIASCCVCLECKKLYEEDGIILHNEKEEEEWLKECI